MKLRIIIDLDNDAFQGGNEGAEVALVLRRYALACEGWEGAVSRNLRDSNGNVVGAAGLEPGDES